MAICVKRRKDGAVLVRVDSADSVVRLEDNYYIHPDDINPALLDITSRTYDCPYKGTCNWIDLRTDKGFVTDGAWVYPDPLKGYEKIAGRIGFYPEHRYYETGECDGE